MKVFVTEYHVGTTAFSSFVYALDKKQAEKYISIRNIGEHIVGEMIDKTFKACPLPSILYKTRKLIPCIHCLAFYGWIAGKFIDMHDRLLRDDGVLHDIMHEMEHPKELGFRVNVFDKLEDLERMIPGLKTFNPVMFDTIIV